MIHFFRLRRLSNSVIGKSGMNRGCYWFLSTASSKESSTARCANSSALALSFLQDSCGLSLDEAYSVSKRVDFSTIDNAEKVVGLLGRYGLTKSCVRKLVFTRPNVLVNDWEQTLKPNLNVFTSLGLVGENLEKIITKEPRVVDLEPAVVVNYFKESGFTDEEISGMILKNPSLFTCNLDKILIPKVNFLRSLGLTELDLRKLLANDPFVLRVSLEQSLIPSIMAIRRAFGEDMCCAKQIVKCSWILKLDLRRHLESNILLLKEHGASDSVLSKMFSFHPKMFMFEKKRLLQILQEAKKLGFNPTEYMFVLAMFSLASISEARWKKKMEIFKRFGLTEQEIASSLRRQPMCMTVSEEKMVKIFEFLTGTAKLKPSFIAKHPIVLMMSLETRIIPRCSVMELLLINDIVKSFNLGTMLRCSAKLFLDNIVKKHEKDVPDIVKAHQGLIHFKGFPDAVLTDIGMISRR